MSAMSAKRSAGSRIVLVLVREIGQRLRSKAFLVSTALLVIVVLANLWSAGHFARLDVTQDRLHSQAFK